MAILAAILRILGAADSSLIVGFPMLIAASGLWNRVRLVWLTTALSMLGYGILAIDAWLRDAPRDSNHHPDIVLAGLAVTGLVIAQQVRRIRAFSAAREPADEERRAAHNTSPRAALTHRFAGFDFDAGFLERRPHYRRSRKRPPRPGSMVPG